MMMKIIKWGALRERKLPPRPKSQNLIGGVFYEEKTYGSPLLTAVAANLNFTGWVVLHGRNILSPGFAHKCQSNRPDRITSTLAEVIICGILSKRINMEYSICLRQRNNAKIKQKLKQLCYQRKYAILSCSAGRAFSQKCSHKQKNPKFTRGHIQLSNREARDVFTKAF